MFTVLSCVWLAGSIATIAIVALARRRRGALARELHELRGALTAARLAIDLMPVLDLDKPGVCRAASDELERSYGSLGEFERLLHQRLVAPGLTRQQIACSASARRARRSRLEARGELERIVLVWSAAAAQVGRELRFEWIGPEGPVFANGPRKRFAEVVTNLLANAIRHGEGSIELTARMRSDTLRIEVADEGPGLPGPLAGLVRRPKGREHGHGLAVARESARALGGSLASAPSSGGARIAFTVPAIHDPSSSDSALAELESAIRGGE